MSDAKSNAGQQSQIYIPAIRVTPADAEKMQRCMTAFPDDMKLGRNFLVFPVGGDELAMRAREAIAESVAPTIEELSFTGRIAVTAFTRYFQSQRTGLPEKRAMIGFAYSYADHVDGWDVASEILACANQQPCLQPSVQNEARILLSNQPIPEEELSNFDN